MSKRWIFVAVMALAGTATAAPFVYPAKWSATPASQAKTGGTLRDWTLGDYKTVNPFTSSEAESIPLTLEAGTGLFTLDPATYEYIPKMAESYKISANKLVWTINLRSGMKFSDGSPITADDFVLSAKIHADENVGSNEYSSWYVNDKPIKMEKVDSDTLRVTFPSVTADAIADLSGSVWPSKVFGPIYASKGAAGIKSMWTLSVDPKEVVSAGEWKYTGYRPGERATYVKNPYFGEWNKDSA
ncbi:MAG TPA: ABC transporter substrate-binding protein, partial [Deinococcales bacterium]|nr:ABC transporter substrate-binding protein [Deinococcales bacterium]